MNSSNFVNDSVTKEYLLELIDKIGKKKTPCLLLDIEKIKDKYSLFANSLENVEVFYSVKANSSSGVISELEKLGSGFDIASVGELETVFANGGKGNKITFSAPTKIPWHIKYAYQKGVRLYAFDSRVELEKISDLAPKSSVFCRVSVPNIGSEWPLAGKFGVEPGEVVGLLKHAEALNLKADGMAFHVGSQCLRPRTWVEALKIIHKIWRKAAKRGLDLNILNLGGGFPVKYQKDIPYLPNIIRLIRKCIRELFPAGIRVLIEPGRAMVGDAGVLISRVINVAERNSGRWVYLDTGIYNGLLEIMEGFSYKIATLKDEGNKKHEVTLAGPTCDSTDVIARNVLLPELEVGDWVFIINTGAYTTSYEYYNGIRFPETILF